MMKRDITVAIAVSAVLLPALAGALTPAEKCESQKLKWAGKYAFCRMKAESKAIRRNEPPDYTKCDDKYSQKWALTESKAAGSCPVSGDEAIVGLQTIDCTDGLTATIGGSPPAGCVGDLLSCEASLITCGSDLTTCGSDLTTCGTDLSTCNTNLGTCQSDLAAAQVCGNGVIDGGEDCDQGDLSGATCVTEGFAGGDLSCASGCAFETSGCYATRFVDNLDGTISDNETGLMWEKKVARGGGANFADPHDADNTYRWSGSCSVNTGKRCQPTAAASTLCSNSIEGGSVGCAQCTGGDGTCTQSTTLWTTIAALNAASFAGQNDWRAPTLSELLGIADYLDGTSPTVYPAFHAGGCGGACTDITVPGCSCTQIDYYWTATTYAPNTDNAWFVTFNNGNVASSGKGFTNLYFRAVRGGS